MRTIRIRVPPADLAAEMAATRKWLVVFLAFSVWYSFLVGHVANDFRGVGA